MKITQAAFESFMDARVDELREGMPNWPDMCCGWTCRIILPDLILVFGGEYRTVGGFYDDGMPDPKRPNEPSGPVGHVFLIRKYTRQIIDPTVGQFRHYPDLGVMYDQEAPYRVFEPGQKEYGWYYWNGMPGLNGYKYRNYARAARRALYADLSGE